MYCGAELESTGRKDISVQLSTFGNQLSVVSTQSSEKDDSRSCLLLTSCFLFPTSDLLLLTFDLAHHLPQYPHILHVFPHFRSLGGFENLRKMCKSSVIHQETEAAESYAAFADMIVTIHSGTALLLRVVHVKSNETVEPYHCLEIGEG